MRVRDQIKLGTFRGKGFKNTTWHHHGRVGGLLPLVDTADHKNRHNDYHPKGKGGRNIWGGGSPCR
nr:HNH endonuclease [Pseudomonas sp. PGPPP1]